MVRSIEKKTYKKKFESHVEVFNLELTYNFHCFFFSLVPNNNVFETSLKLIV